MARAIWHGPKHTILKGDIMSGSNEGTSYNVIASILTLGENGARRMVGKFSPTVRDGQRKIDGKVVNLVGFDDALEYALNDALGTGQWEYGDTDSENYAVIKTNDSRVEIFVAWIRSGSRCQTCGALRDDPRVWCHDAKGCDDFRKNPVVKTAKRRQGFGKAKRATRGK